MERIPRSILIKSRTIKERMNLFTTVILRVFVALGLLALLVIVFQDFLVFPGLSLPWGEAKGPRPPETLPAGVQSLFVRSVDGVQIEVWRMEAPAPEKGRRKVAIVFHGNAETIENTIDRMSWLRELGVSSYSVEYRGFGRSSGWPSEAGFYRDADAVISLMREREGEAAFGSVGISIGAAPASYAAARLPAEFVILFSPYTSLHDRVKEETLYRPLLYFFKYNFPTLSFLNELGPESCVLLAHGKNDTTILAHHTEDIAKSLEGKLKLQALFFDGVAHNDLFAKSALKVAESLQRCDIH